MLWFSSSIVSHLGRFKSIARSFKKPYSHQFGRLLRPRIAQPALGHQRQVLGSGDESFEFVEVIQIAVLKLVQKNPSDKFVESEIQKLSGPAIHEPALLPAARNHGRPEGVVALAIGLMVVSLESASVESVRSGKFVLPGQLDQDAPQRIHRRTFARRARLFRRGRTAPDFDGDVFRRRHDTVERGASWLRKR